MNALTKTATHPTRSGYAPALHRAYTEGLWWLQSYPQKHACAVLGGCVMGCNPKDAAELYFVAYVGNVEACRRKELLLEAEHRGRNLGDVVGARVLAETSERVPAPQGAIRTGDFLLSIAGFGELDEAYLIAAAYHARVLTECDVRSLAKASSNRHVLQLWTHSRKDA